MLFRSDAPLVDPVFGALISLWILRGAVLIARQSFDLLMDRELPLEDRERILRIARAQPEVLDVHDLRTRSAGTHIFVQMHVELEPDMRLARAHEIADRVEHDIRAAYPNAEIIIHQDPAGIDEPHRAASPA